MSKKSAQRWLQIADRDLALANLLPGDHADGAAYHYQQAAEKYLKAFLAGHQVPLKKSRNISTLVLEACRLDAVFFSLTNEADPDVLTSFATLYRYPNEEEEEFPAKEELAQAKAFCEKAKALVEVRVAELPEPPRDRSEIDGIK